MPKIESFFWLFSPIDLPGACPKPKTASKLVKMKFFELGVDRKVVGNVENYLNVIPAKPFHAF